MNKKEFDDEYIDLVHYYCTEFWLLFWINIIRREKKKKKFDDEYIDVVVYTSSWKVNR